MKNTIISIGATLLLFPRQAAFTSFTKMLHMQLKAFFLSKLNLQIRLRGGQKGKPGVYLVQISGRSNGRFIDKLIVYSSYLTLGEALLR